VTPESANRRKVDSEQLRREFDASFALSARAADEALEDLLMIRVCEGDYALRARELSGIAALRKLIAVPSPSPELLGLVAVRGVLVPVFGLSLLLGYAPDSEPLRWLALVGTEQPLAFAFHALIGFKRLPHSAFSLAAGAPNPAAGERETVSFEEQVRVVVGVPALVASLRSRLGREGPKKET
jgi:purine-binding chemotaxis protein CheW